MKKTTRREVCKFDFSTSSFSCLHDFMFSCQKKMFSTEHATVYARTLQSVIPMAVSIPVPPTNSLTYNTMWVYSTVSDPLVNKFPGDWTTTTGTTAPTTTMQYANAYTAQADGGTYAKYPESAATLATLADPDSYWSPTVDNRAVLTHSADPPTIPRSARFPSVGYLQYVRTGIIPDDEINTPYPQQHGTPFRLLSFSPSTSANQAIVHGGPSPITSPSYPDWAMLDLFYLPSSLLGYGSPYEPLANPTYSTTGPTMVTYQNTNVVNNMFLFGTYGGATSGRINPNGSVIYTTNANIPTPNITRTVPLQALLHGLVVNQTQIAPYTNTIGNNDFNVPYLNAGTAVNETAVAQDIANYLTTNTYGVGGGPAPLRMPGEICNMPQIAALTAANNATRNDLVRQIIGNLTTQSNTYSVWVAGQSIVKSKLNSSYGIYESGDQITASVRYHFVVERYLDTGIDGMYGNSVSPGSDGVVGTLDDPVSATLNPATPRYLYRVIYAEEIR